MKERTKYKAVIMIFMTVLASVSMFFSVTAAWFVTVRNAEANASCFKIKDNVLIEDVKFYQYKSSNGPVVCFNNEESPYEVGDGRYKTDLGYYNLFENNYQTLMEITLTSDAVEGHVSIDFVALTFASKSHLTANMTGAPDYPLTNNPSVYNSLSSIVDFFIFYEEDISFESDGITLNRNSARNLVDEDTDKQVTNFTNSKGEIVSSRSVTLAHFNAADVATTNPSSAKIYLMFDYNEENCAKMYGNNIGNEAIENGHFAQPGTGFAVLKFAADFEFDLVVR